MIVPGSKSISFITETIGEGQVQPCGIDMTLKEVHSLSDAGAVDFDNSKRKISASRKLEFDSDGKLDLGAGELQDNL